MTQTINPPLANALSGLVGRRSAGQDRWKFIRAHGALGADHYVVSDLKPDGSEEPGKRIMAITDMVRYTFFSGIAEAALGTEDKEVS